MTTALFVWAVFTAFLLINQVINENLKKGKNRINIQRVKKSVYNNCKRIASSIWHVISRSKGRILKIHIFFISMNNAIAVP